MAKRSSRRQGTAVSLGAATFVMSGGNPDEGWTVLRTDDGYDLTRFDGKTGALGATYKSAAAPEGAVRAGLVVGRPATFTRPSEIEVWNPATGRARTIGIVACTRSSPRPAVHAVIWYDQSCSDEGATVRRARH